MKRSSWVILIFAAILMAAAVMILIVKNGSGRRQNDPTTAPIVPTAPASQEEKPSDPGSAHEPEDEMTSPAEEEGQNAEAADNPSDTDISSAADPLPASAAQDHSAESGEMQNSQPVVIRIDDQGDTVSGSSGGPDDNSRDSADSSGDIIAEITLPQN